MLIEYVGKKDSRADTVAGTGTVWLGQGDVQDVPPEAAAKLLRHPDVWRAVGDPVAASAGVKADGPGLDGGKPAGDDAITEAHFAEMTDDELRAFAKKRDIKVHHKKTGDALRDAVWEGLKG